VAEYEVVKRLIRRRKVAVAAIASWRWWWPTMVAVTSLTTSGHQWKGFFFIGHR
jgi:hypothetical protein